jgi:hypothetical protein
LDLSSCQQVICPACGEADGNILYGFDADAGPGGRGVAFGGLCPGVDACADFRCFVDAGSRTLSPNCEAALTSLADFVLDGG